MKRLNALNKRILIIPDLHCPFEHPSAFEFLKAIKKKYKPDLIVNLGDEIDGHSISFHDSDPDLQFSPSQELETAIDRIQDLYKIFPKSYLCESNHGSLIYRRAKFHGLPSRYFRSYQEVLETPNWQWHEDYLLETKLGEIYICHGKSGVIGKLSKEMGTYGCVQGHFHSKMYINWMATATGERFDAISGCLIDRDSLAFSYGKNHIPKPVLGITLISKTGYPRLLKMQLNKKNRWIGILP